MRRFIPHCLAAAAVLALPGCSFQVNGLGPTPNFEPGQPPLSSVIFCDIEKKGTGFDGTSRVCVDAASPDIASQALPLTSAALLLNTGRSSAFAVDKSPGAVSRCGQDGEIVEFVSAFPTGQSQCLNCGNDSPPSSTDANATCVAICEDLLEGTPVNPNPPDIVAFCQNHAHASTNVPVSGCPTGFANACTDGGTLRTDFVDPRIAPDPVVWTDPIGVVTGGSANNDLTATGTSLTNMGADSTQIVTSGDAYVEFSAADNTTNHVIGFSVPSCALPCPDTDPSITDITYFMNLSTDGQVRISQHGTKINGPDVNGTWGPYSAGDRFRVTLKDHGDGTFDVQFSKIIGTCTPGSPCNEQVITTFTGGAADAYPVRVDASLNQNGAALLNVVLMQIKKE